MLKSRAPFDVLHLTSRVLAGNLAGVSVERTLPVYLPPQYHAEPGRRFPVVFYLAGYSGWGRMKIAAEKAWEEPLWAEFDRKMASGELEPAIVAFPDCFTPTGGSQYVNSPALGRFADHVCDELAPTVDAQLRTRPGREQRGVMGKSSGGFGALYLAMTRPDVFGLACSTAGDSHFSLTMVADIAKAAQHLRKSGGVAAFLQAFAGKRKKSSQDMTTMMVVCMAQCYSPDLDEPVIRAQLPVDLDTGRWRPEVWQRWLAFDPVQMVDHHADALRSLRLLFLDAGTSDEWCLDLGHRALAARLRELGVAHAFEEFDGGHMDIDWRMSASLARMSAVWRAQPEG